MKVNSEAMMIVESYMLRLCILKAIPQECYLGHNSMKVAMIMGKPSEK